MLHVRNHSTTPPGGWSRFADFDAHWLDVRLNPEWLRLGPGCDIRFMTCEDYHALNVGPLPVIDNDYAARP